eukprot:TRINITY_DN2729_c1_g4_i1.p1 TRINITY_DN2729_c1_g4~~TRINITY_DN2729_c1_g4_i1.p1  ORF type:complete len:519 (+),score=91.05 TRINITY_DN2729_c1_g4_i1:162-1718(+)
MAGGQLKYSGISCVGQSDLGSFCLATDKISWASSSTSQVTIAGKELQAAQSQRSCGRDNWLLKLKTTNPMDSRRFANFRLSDLNAIKSHFKTCFDVDLIDVPMATGGNSWGSWVADEEDGELRLTTTGGEVAMELPTAIVGQASLASKGELSVEVKVAETSQDKEEEYLQEIRFFFPGTGSGPAMTPTQARDELLRLLGSSSDAATSRPDNVCQIPDLNIVQPRGKHTLDFFRDHVKLHGKTQTYTLAFERILSMYLLQLPTKDAAFVLHVSVPPRKGAGRQAGIGNYLVFTLPSARQVIVDLPQDLQTKFGVQAGAYEGVNRVLPTLFKELSGKKIAAPSSDAKQKLKDGDDDSGGVKCSYKTQPGYIFFFKRSLMFLTKPVITIKFDDIKSVEFKQLLRRSTYDLVIHEGSGQEIEFVHLDEKTLQGVKSILAESGIQIMGGGAGAAASRTRGAPARAASDKARGVVAAAVKSDDDDEDADEDFEDDDNSSSDASVDDADEEEEAAGARRSKRLRK